MRRLLASCTIKKWWQQRSLSTASVVGHFPTDQIQLMAETCAAKLALNDAQHELLAAKKDAEAAKREAELMKANLQLQVQNLTEKLNTESAYKLHYAKKLTVRAIIEQYEQSFGVNSKKEIQGRYQRWKAFLDANPDSAFVKFAANGFTSDSVANTVTMLYNSASAQIHSIDNVANLVIPMNGLNEDQIKLLHILIELTGWKEIITLGTKLNENSQSED
jgi:hypothetical protein